MNLLKRAAVAVASAALVTGAAGVVATPVFAVGQPNQSCEENPTTPGHSGTAPGSAFSGGTADSKYAGNGPGSTQHAGSDHAVSQYDVACTHNQSSH